MNKEQGESLPEAAFINARIKLRTVGFPTSEFPESLKYRFECKSGEAAVENSVEILEKLLARIELKKRGMTSEDFPPEIVYRLF